MTLLKTPTAQLAINGGSQHPDKRKAGGHGPTLADEVEHLLPTPDANADKYRINGDSQQSKGLAAMARRGEIHALLPTPSAADGLGGHERRGGARGDELLLNGVAKEMASRLLPTPLVGSNSPAAHGQISGQFRDQMAEALTRWGDYAPAIHRWEQILGRPAPAPTMTSAKGNPQLAPRFVEWMQGCDEGWVDDVPGLSRNEKLKALGNGVVWQQAAEAVRRMLAIGGAA